MVSRILRISALIEHEFLVGLLGDAALDLDLLHCDGHLATDPDACEY
jgi:hypothetical protein